MIEIPFFSCRKGARSFFSSLFLAFGAEKISRRFGSPFDLWSLSGIVGMRANRAGCDRLLLRDHFSQVDRGSRISLFSSSFRVFTWWSARQVSPSCFPFFIADMVPRECATLSPLFFFLSLLPVIKELSWSSARTPFLFWFDGNKTSPFPRSPLPMTLRT